MGKCLSLQRVYTEFVLCEQTGIQMENKEKVSALML